MHERDEWLAQWSRTVTEVERGYELTFDDYLNDLDMRHKLRVIGEHDDQWADLLELDTRFRNATFPSGRCVWGEENAQAEGWDREKHWYYWLLPKKQGLAFEAEY
ncbi:hypothetical protein [Gemmatimonas sp.]|jgi:hypothetical protein|uniref:hypothetical protein n=1 Tax=Gemmatimonas sp. TaxID=1962908 RepID=UPI0022C1F2B3|nr:hypothetical protein [Gemmatimonas sp.]MCA2984201.1 hypothetical protein [Gemmatimonas sp.]MCA2988366.1 hypothetical protein [Gemmatimonas sp.]MCA2991772.1 hypothetical protein [Gemmatimonas sp.]MCA2996666.1 hypothetical protein [Gemmatimonas sp.]MCE2954528.1 hypothetical protein [Gemmatimonas sp.]